MKRIISALLISAFMFGTGTMCGCSKDSVMSMFNSVIMNLGDNALTRNADLHGVRTFGSDTYAGTYEVVCENATFRETLFGNTSVERPDGYTLRITADFEVADGMAGLYLKEGFENVCELFKGAGIYEEEIEIGPGSDYFILETEHFTGNIALRIE